MFYSILKLAVVLAFTLLACFCIYWLSANQGVPSSVAWFLSPITIVFSACAASGFLADINRAQSVCKVRHYGNGE